MSAATTDSAIDKVVLAVTKPQGREDWPLWSATIRVALGQTWAYVGGDKVSPPESTDMKYEAWGLEDRNAHWRIFLALSDSVKQTVLLHVDSHAVKLSSILRSQFEASGVSAEFYAKQDYENAKLSDYDTIGDFITALTNLAHVFNKEIKGTVGCIEERNIAMHVLHSLPPCMHPVQTLILETAPESDNSDWDLSKLKQVITNDERCAWAAGEQLGTKLDLTSEPNALTVEGRYHQAKRRDPNDPQWLAKQTCWRCSKVGHIHPKCTASQAEREAYYAKKVAEQNAANVTTGKLEVYAKAMFAKGINDGSEEWADIMVAEAIISGPEADTEVVIDKALVEHQAHAAQGGSIESK